MPKKNSNKGYHTIRINNPSTGQRAPNMIIYNGGSSEEAREKAIKQAASRSGLAPFDSWHFT